MKLTKRTVLFSALCLGLGVSQSLFAGDFDYYQSTKSVPITTTDFSNTTNLGKVTVTCPEAGYLVAAGSAGILLTPKAGDTLGVVQGGISITLDNTAPYAADPNHYNSIVFNVTTHNSAIPSFIQRVDACTAGQTVNYRLVGWHEYAGDGSYAFQPRLVVQFFNNRI